MDRVSATARCLLGPAVSATAAAPIPAPTRNTPTISGSDLFGDATRENILTTPARLVRAHG
jgi:hypothetical protein